MNYRKAHIISLIMTFLGLAIALPFLISNSSSVFKYLGFVIMLAGTIIRVAYCICPNCKRVLYYQNFSLPNFCPNCGEELEPQNRDNNDE